MSTYLLKEWQNCGWEKMNWMKPAHFLQKQLTDSKNYAVFEQTLKDLVVINVKRLVAGEHRFIYIGGMLFPRKLIA